MTSPKVKRIALLKHIVLLIVLALLSISSARAQDPRMIVTGRTPFSFGTVKVGHDSTRYFYIFNMGGGSHALHAQIVAPSSTNFELLSSPTLTIDSGRYDSVVLRFAPKQEGALLDSVLIVHDADTQRTKSPLHIRLTGNALSASDTSPRIFLSTTLLQMSSAVGTPVTGKFLIRNTSDTMRYLTGSVTGFKSPFVLQSGDTAFTLATGDSAVFIVSFTPTTAGVYNDTLQIHSNSDSLHRDLIVALRGSGNDSHPSMSLSIRYVDLGIVPTGKDTIYELTLGNTGNSGILYDTVIGPSSGPFSVTQGSGATVMQAKQTRKIDVRFNSSVPGTFIDSLIINTNAAASDAHIVVPLVAIAQVQAGVDARQAAAELHMTFHGNTVDIANPSSASGAEISVFDEAGNCRIAQTLTTSATSVVDISALPHGSYFVELTYGNRSQIKRIVH